MPIDPPLPPPNFVDPDNVLEQLAIKKGDSVADLGCGSGYYSFAAAKLVEEEGKVYAVDIQKTVLSALQSKIKLQGVRNIKAIWADIEIPGSTKIKDSSIDLVLLASIFYQIKEHKQVLAEAKRIVKDNSKIVVIDWSEANVPIGPTAKLRVAKDNMLQHAEAVGLKLQREIEIDNYHYGLVFEK